MGKIEKATDNIQKVKIENKNDEKIKNISNKEQKEVIDVFKKTFTEGSNLVKIGNKEVSESNDLMDKGLNDSGFKMLNLGHENIKKGMSVIKDARSKLNVVTRKLDEVENKNGKNINVNGKDMGKSRSKNKNKRNVKDLKNLKNVKK